MPATLDERPQVAWEVKLPRSGLGGIAATADYVFLGDRDLEDFQDVYRCLDAKTGRQLWQVEALAIGALDYGNSPRATPLIVGGNVIFAGALGEVVCVKIADGTVVWKRNLRDDFGFDGELPWGFCGSPLMADGKLIVQPGGPKASLVALNPDTGKLLWKAAGSGPSYGSLIAANFGGKRQIVGHDEKTIGGWDVATGKRLWTVTPQFEGDFNVPTPIAYDGKLVVITEGNGARLFQFNKHGAIDPEPIADNRQLKPSMSSAVVVGTRLFCVKRLLYELDLLDEMKTITKLREPGLDDYGSIIASDTHLLVTGKGVVLLIDLQGDELKVVSRMQAFDGADELYSHPAIVGTRLFIRGEHSLRCIDLTQTE